MNMGISKCNNKRKEENISVSYLFTHDVVVLAIGAAKMSSEGALIHSVMFERLM